jgi:hypothetical protein
VRSPDDQGVVTQLDARKRVTLGNAATSTQYLMTVEDGGRIILEPAVVLTQVERDYLENTEARDAVSQALTRADRTVRRSRKRSS